MSGVCCTVGASHFKRECLRLPRSLRDFMRPRRAPAVKNFLWTSGTSREVGHWCGWNELYDPLSSFVPVLEPRPRRGFLSGWTLATGRATAALSWVESVHRREPDTAAWLRRDQAVWPGSRSGGVCNLLSSVIIAARGRPF